LWLGLHVARPGGETFQVGFFVELHVDSTDVKTTCKEIQVNTLVAYFRVSTTRQGLSGLGLEGQKAAVEAYALASNLRVLASYTEIESGRKNERPQLRAALLHVKRAKSVLCVAKLDRLSRNAVFLLALLEARTPFVATDNPHANELTIGVLAVIAQDEAKRISERTKAALAAKKARGAKLGSAREGHWLNREASRLEGGRKGRERSAIVRSRLARQSRDEFAPIVLGLQAEGLSLGAIAQRLNAEGWTTRRGKPWNAVYVCRLLQMLRGEGEGEINARR
jgi:DNA invertase Pin-like site-specific DNA recombinase